MQRLSDRKKSHQEEPNPITMEETKEQKKAGQHIASQTAAPQKSIIAAGQVAQGGTESRTSASSNSAVMQAAVKWHGKPIIM